MWIVIRLAPALAKGSTNLCGSDSMRCVSKKSFEPSRRSAARVSGPKERFGTKCPSIMSRCIHFSPSFATAAAPSPSAAWSLARREGARTGSFMHDVLDRASPDVEDGVGHPVGERVGEEGERVVLGLELVVAGAEGHRAEAIVQERLLLDLDHALVE